MSSPRNVPDPVDDRLDSPAVRFKQPRRGSEETGDPLKGLAAAPDATGRSVASDAAVYALGVYAAQVFLFGAGLMQKALLGPRGAGFWALIGTIGSFFALTSLGTFDGATRQIPRHRGRRDYPAAAAVADTACSVSVLAMVATSLVVAAVALIFGSGWAPQLRYGLVFLALTAPLAATVDCHELILQATKRFPVLALTQVLKGLVALTLQTLLVWVFGLWGMFMGAALTAAAVLSFWRALGLAGWRTPAFRLRIERGRLGELMGIGVPIMVFSQIWLLFVSIDNLIVVRFINVTNLGYYALAVSATNYVLFLPKAVAGALFPRMQERLAPTQEVAAIRHYVTDVQRLLAYMVMPPFIAAAFFLLPMLIRQALPAFDPAISVVQIMVAGSFAIALVHMPIELLITAGYRWSASALMLACLAVNAAANYAAVAVLDWGVRGAAFATSFSYLVLLLSTTSYGLSKAVERRKVLGQLGVLVVALAYTIGTLWGIEELVGPGGGSVAWDALVALAKLALFLAVLSPWLLLAQRRFQALTTLRVLLTDGLRQVRLAAVRATGGPS